jgi:GNAT superfamily N-acetyltransferase
MGMSIAIREAAKADLVNVLSLLAQPDMDNGSILEYEKAEQILCQQSEYPFYKLYVAETDSRIVGSFSLLVMVNLGHMGAPSAIVEDFVVAPDLHRQGVGRAMMEHALSIAKLQDCYKVMLSSNLIRERAHKFYEELGFERHGYSFQVIL